MEAAGALVCEAPGEVDGIAAFERHRVASASRKSDGASAENVDRGYHFEAVC